MRKRTLDGCSTGDKEELTGILTKLSRCNVQQPYKTTLTDYLMLASCSSRVMALIKM